MHKLNIMSKVNIKVTFVLLMGGGACDGGDSGYRRSFETGHKDYLHMPQGAEVH